MMGKSECFPTEPTLRITPFTTSTSATRAGDPVPSTTDAPRRTKDDEYTMSPPCNFRSIPTIPILCEPVRLSPTALNVSAHAVPGGDRFAAEWLSNLLSQDKP